MVKSNKLKIILISVIILFSACFRASYVSSFKNDTGHNTPLGFPVVKFPEDNAFTKARWELGKKLFFDKRFASDNSVSCASCHLPSLGFSDSVAFSKGAEERLAPSNSPSLLNIAYHPYFTRAGGIPTLEMQILVPIQEHNEFNSNILLIADKLKKDKVYRNMSKKAFNRELDYYVITRAIANFERSLVGGNSKFDQYHFQNNKKALNDEELKGMDLFFSEKTNCSKCHSDFNFTNYNFENNGLYETYIDSGRKRLTEVDSDYAKFKVPSIRNVSLTPPYMHDGSIRTLEAVIEHYNTGGKNIPEKNKLIKPLNLSPVEKIQLLKFLLALTDIDLTNNKNIQQLKK